MACLQRLGWRSLVRDNSMSTSTSYGGNFNRALHKRSARALKRLPSCALATLVAAIFALSSCSGSRSDQVQASGPAATVGVTRVVKKSLGRQITLSSELVPFQEIDVYAKESGYVKKLDVDYGTHVKAGQVDGCPRNSRTASPTHEDQAEIKNATNQVSRAQHELSRYQAQYKALHLQYHALKWSLSEPARNRRAAGSR